MKDKGIVSSLLGIVLFLGGMIIYAKSGSFLGGIPIIIGAALFYLGWHGTRTALIIFGHVCIVMGCLLITQGLYLLPHSKPILSHILFRPLFWGLICLFGGICANFHGFCSCVRAQKNLRNNQKQSKEKIGDRDKKTT